MYEKKGKIKDNKSAIRAVLSSREDRRCMAKQDLVHAYLHASRKLSRVRVQKSFIPRTVTKPPRRTTVDHSNASVPRPLVMLAVAVISLT